MYKIAVNSVVSEESLYHSLSDMQLLLEFDSLTSNNIIKIRNNDIELIPSQRLIGNQAFLDLPAGDLQAGFYDILVDEIVQKNIAFNFNKQESYLEQLNDSEIVGLFPDARTEILSTVSGQPLNEVLNNKYQPLELWMYALSLAFLFLVVEILLFRFMK